MTSIKNSFASPGLKNQRYFWDAYISSLLEKQKKANLFRYCLDLKQGTDLYIKITNNKLLNLASNNYLGLSNHSELKKAVLEAINQFGVGSGASPLVSGHSEPLRQLEQELAQYKETEQAIIFSSGYATNLGLFSALADKHTIVFGDKINHASILDGILLSRAKMIRYRHLDTNHLETLLSTYKNNEKKIVVTDTIFSMDGDLAPLKELVKLKKTYHFLLIVDEAHALGIFGQGKGLTHHYNLHKHIDIQMGTLSKSLGCQGGYVCAQKNIISLLINKARSFIFSTALSPIICQAALAGLNLIKNNPSWGEQLLTLSQEIRNFLKELEFNTGSSNSQIIPIILQDPYITLQAHNFLQKQGVFAPAIRPPAVPHGTSRLRISLRLDLGEKEIKLLKKAFKQLKLFLQKNF
ncbi:MAG: 8-amino-7-oxononanoate synthase [Desulfonauticus sp.]|nr:8-amino-7-oxononanoate synthase [Desulfonauticus sp.]